MPGRTFQAANTSAYRFGFNDKENDRNGSWSGTQLVQDYGFRLYNPAIGKFLSVDPLFQSFPWNSVYAYAENDPINFIDLDGSEKVKPVVTDETMTRLKNSNGIQKLIDGANKDQRVIMRVLYNDRGTIYDRTEEIKPGQGGRSSTLSILWEGSYSGGRHEGDVTISHSTIPFTFTPVKQLSLLETAPVNSINPMPEIKITLPNIKKNNSGDNGAGIPPIAKPAPRNAPPKNIRPQPTVVPQGFLPFEFGSPNGTVQQGPVTTPLLRQAVQIMNASGNSQFFFNVRVGINGANSGQTRNLINSANNGLNNLTNTLRRMGLNPNVRINMNLQQDNTSTSSEYNMSNRQMVPTAVKNNNSN